MIYTNVMILSEETLLIPQFMDYLSLKIEEGTAQMRIYAVGATEYMVSDSEEFKGSKWHTYEPALMTEEKLKSNTKTLYVRFKDNKNRLSTPFAVKIEAKE